MSSRLAMMAMVPEEIMKKVESQVKLPMAASMLKKLLQVTSTETVASFHMLLQPLAELKKFCLSAASWREAFTPEMKSRKKIMKYRLRLTKVTISGRNRALMAVSSIRASRSFVRLKDPGAAKNK